MGSAVTFIVLYVMCAVMAIIAKSKFASYVQRERAAANTLWILAFILGAVATVFLWIFLDGSIPWSKHGNISIK